MRKLILAASLLAIAYPAAAQPVEDDYDGPPPVARRLPPPGVAGAMGNRVAGIADALMDIDIGPVAEAVEPGRRHRYRTLGDYATRGDPYARQRMHRSIESGSARLDATARELAVMTPMLLRTLQDARRRIKGAWNSPPGQYDRYRDSDRPAPGRQAPPPSDYPFEDE